LAAKSGSRFLSSGLQFLAILEVWKKSLIVYCARVHVSNLFFVISIVLFDYNRIDSGGNHGSTQNRTMLIKMTSQ